ncbi:OmpA family protein [Tenacibaculum maritimum]|uniref:OmpA family protein n=1 Tax=Tenacibaculum maritimum TaxID=107401 RepID=UPI00041F8EEF|nr:OmpA family protein [Tenacibaculum maritimum]
MKIKIALLLILSVAAQIFSQSKRVADRYFGEFAYVKSAKLYEAIYQKGDTSKHVVSRLADSYYNNAETDKAEFWYNKLVNSYKENLESEYLFKYAQTLRSNGKYKESDVIFLDLASKDSLYNNRKEALENDNYLIDYSKNKDKRISVRNLSTNTALSDFGGFLLNGKVYFTSAKPRKGKRGKLYKWNNQPFLNLYKGFEIIKLLEGSQKDTVVELISPKILNAPINTKYHEATPIFTKDGRTMYFTRDNFDGRRLRKDKELTVNLKLYRAELIDGEWTNVTELPFNSNNYSVGHPALSVDEKTLYFVSDMPGGFGGTDVYRVKIKEKNQYGTPVNLGNTVNTSDREMFPFIGKDSTLYFSSNGHLGLGLLDIFQTKIKNDTTYTPVKNLGYPFNSKRDDFAFFIAEKGKKGFFSSNREGGKGDDDIYSYFIYTDVPVCKQTIAGAVINTKTGEPIDAATVKLIDPKGEVIKEVLSKEDGTYKFTEVLCDITYSIQGTKLDHKSDRKSISTTAKAGDFIEEDLNLVPLILGDQIVINPIYFDYDKSDIREDAQYELEHIVTVLNNHPSIVIKIESHTDSRGTSTYNRQLSDSRAKSTRDYIISRGISSDRIESAIGYGEDRLLNNCDDLNKNKCTEAEHQLNRRSYFYVVKGGENVKANQEAEKKRVKKANRRRLKFMRSNRNYKRNNYNRHRTSSLGKCLKDEEDKCQENRGEFEIKYRN